MVHEKSNLKCISIALFRPFLVVPKNLPLAKKIGKFWQVLPKPVSCGQVFWFCHRNFLVAKVFATRKSSALFKLPNLFKLPESDISSDLAESKVFVPETLHSYVSLCFTSKSMLGFEYFAFYIEKF